MADGGSKIGKEERQRGWRRGFGGGARAEGR